MRMVGVKYHAERAYRIDLADRDSGKTIPCSITPTTMTHKKTAKQYPGLVYVMSRALGGDIEYGVAADGWRKDGVMLKRNARTEVTGEWQEVEGVFEYSVPLLTDQHPEVDCVYMILFKSKDDAFKVYAALALEEQAFNSERGIEAQPAHSPKPGPGDTSSGGGPVTSVRPPD